MDPDRSPSRPPSTRATSATSPTGSNSAADRPRPSRELLKLGRCAIATLSTVDRGVGEIDRLAAQGDLDETAIFFTSDNGYLFGEHRIYLNKVYPYEEVDAGPAPRPSPGYSCQPAPR